MRRISIKLIKSSQDDLKTVLMIQAASEKLNRRSLSDEALNLFGELLANYSVNQISRGIRSLIVKRSKLSAALLIESIKQQNKPVNLIKNILAELRMKLVGKQQRFIC